MMSSAFAGGMVLITLPSRSRTSMIDAIGRLVAREVQLAVLRVQLLHALRGLVDHLARLVRRGGRHVADDRVLRRCDVGRARAAAGGAAAERRDRADRGRSSARCS